MRFSGGLALALARSTDAVTNAGAETLDEVNQRRLQIMVASHRPHRPRLLTSVRSSPAKPPATRSSPVTSPGQHIQASARSTIGTSATSRSLWNRRLSARIETMGRRLLIPVVSILCTRTGRSGGRACAYGMSLFAQERDETARAGCRDAESRIGPAGLSFQMRQARFRADSPSHNGMWLAMSFGKPGKPLTSSASGESCNASCNRYRIDRPIHLE